MHSSDALLRVSRLFKIVTLVRSHSSSPLPLGRSALAEACGCTKRTIQRDIALLLEAGIPLDFDASRRAYILPEKSKWVFPVASLTPEDALALALTRAVVDGTGIPHQASLLRTLDKLTGSLPPTLSALCAEAAQSLQAGPAPRDYSQAPLNALLQAAQAEQTIEIEYQSLQSGERTWRRVDPYQVTARDGQFWELHGWCHRRQGMRTFALDGVQSARTTSEPFSKRMKEWMAFQGATGVVGGLRSGAVVEVRARFDREVVPYAQRRQWPEGLSIVVQEEGTALLTGTAQGTDGLVVELLRWRRHARVEGGPELLAAMREEAQAIVALYGEA